jgi:hypothetical protein
MTHRPTALAALSMAAAVALTALTPPAQAAPPAKAAPPATTPHAATTTHPALPQTKAARRAATWLGHQFRGSEFLPEPGSKAPDYGETAQAVVALADAKVDPDLVRSATNFLSRHIDAYVHLSGTTVDQPGALANLVLAAKAAGDNPASFGGTDLLSRILATEVQSGPEAGQFGTDATYPGAYIQGLVLDALAAARDTPASHIGPAADWLISQECADGGWEYSRSSTASPCPPVVPRNYQGPDTNSTSLAMIGLAAVGRTVPRAAVRFLESGQTASGGWGYYPNYTHDADSTAEVIQALLAARVSRGSTAVDRGIAALLAMQITTGADAGALSYEVGAHHALTADALATEQAIPALLGDL